MTQEEDQAPSKKLDNGKLSIFSPNIQSLRHKTNDLFLLLEELYFPDIVAITKHWLNVDEPVFINNYSTVARFNETNVSHEGTLIMSKGNDFLVVTKFDNLISEKIFEFSIVYNNK